MQNNNKNSSSPDAENISLPLNRLDNNLSASSKLKLGLSSQPFLGLAALLLSILLSLGVISLFTPATFATWVTFFVVVCVPVQIVIGMVWQANYPASLNFPQPAKGIVAMLLTLVVAAGIATTIFFTQSGAVSPPTPFTLMYVIFSVLVAFWFVIVWGCWPLSAFTKNQFLLGLGILLVTYFVGYLLFAALFNFDAMVQAPFYSAAFDPKGAFPAFYILSYSVTTVSVIFACVLLDFWPITKFAAFRTQPLMGLVSTIYILSVAAGIFWVGVGVIGIDPVMFMVHVSIAFLFGALVPLIMFEGKLFSALPQPAKGLTSIAIAAAAGAVLPRIYAAASTYVSGPLQSGAPSYQLEFWMASALLAMTFPIMVVVGSYFNFWPLRTQPRD